MKIDCYYCPVKLSKYRFNSLLLYIILYIQGSGYFFNEIEHNWKILDFRKMCQNKGIENNRLA